MLFQEQVTYGQHQRMTGMHQDRAGDSRFVGWLQGILLKADAIVAFEHWLLFAAIAAGDSSITLPNGSGDVGYLEPSQLAWINLTADLLEGLQEERSHKVGLQAACFGLFHFSLHGIQPVGTHRLLCECVSVEK